MPDRTALASALFPAAAVWPWGVVVGAVVVALALWVWRMSRRRGRAPPPAAGLAVAAGGAAWAFADRLLLGGVADLAGGPFNLGDALFGLGAAAWLVWTGYRRMQPAGPNVPLHRQPSARLDLDRFRRGIDNVGIDVRLSPAFGDALRGLVAGLTRLELARVRGVRGQGPTRQEAETLRNAYGEMLQRAVYRGRREGEVRLVALLQVAAVKTVFHEVAVGFERQLDELRRRLETPSGRRDGEKVVLYEQVFRAARSRQAVQARVAARVAELLRQEEAASGVSLREAVLGERWPIPPEALFNPLLRSADPCRDNGVLLEHYVLLGRRGPERRGLHHLEAFIDRTVATASVPSATDDNGGWLLQAGLPECGPDFPLAWEGRPADALWWDVPENMRLLFDPEAVSGALERAEQAGDGETRDRLRRHRRWVRHNLERLEALGQRWGLTRRALAAYATAELRQELAGRVNPMLVFQLFCGGRGGWGALRQLRQPDRNGEPPPLPPGRLLRAAWRVWRAPPEERRRALLRFVQDVTALRRDLVHYGRMQGALERVRLRDEAQEVALARANGCLHEFLGEEEAAVAPGQAAVRAHAVLKADLRGSTRVTRELLGRELNPATHFDRHFFSPLNHFLQTFGAEKVFMEGDAVIAAIMDRAGDEAGPFCVARACGLARRILEVVAGHNRVLQEEGLPELRVGIGITYTEGAPAYLFDDQRPVMISEGIDRADRLSSSAWQLTERYGADAADVKHVRVFELTEDHPLHGEKGETDLRYNVNGIELEGAGFERLAEEIELRPLATPAPDGEAFQAGRYRDAEGEYRDLVVRVGRVRRFGNAGPEGPTGRRYYEVVADPALLRRLREGAATDNP